jgi:hypothetical protein
MYFSTFPWHYLNCLHNINIDSLKEHEKIPLHHSRLCNLLNTDSRTEFIKHIVALLRTVAAGDVNIGHLRKGAGKIHRRKDPSGNTTDESVIHPPQEEIDERWRELFVKEYTV